MEQLDRFMHCALPADEFFAVVRHLMSGCVECKRVTGKLWKTLGGPPNSENQREGLDGAQQHASRRRQPRLVPRRRLPWQSSPKAYAAMAGAAQEIVRDLTGELETIRDRFQALLANLPGDSEEGSVSEELRAVIGCVLQDSLRPMIEALHAVAVYRSEPDGEAPESA